MQSTIQLLRELDVLEPIATGLAPRLYRDESIKAVIFDIYGTLLISESGDIDEISMTAGSLKQALRASHIQLLARDEHEERQILHHLLRSFTLSIKQQHKVKSEQQSPFPEVDVVEIWEQVLHCAMKQHLIKSDGHEHIKCLTFVFEVLSNRVYPMPGMEKILSQMNGNGTVTGIVSNAQFYTPMIMNYFLTHRNGADFIKGIEPDLQIFSYKEKSAKPDIRLFQRLLAEIAKRHTIKPEECLFVGNDMYKDIFPAQQAGMKTALFAGDKRSLRLRSDMPELKDVKPDHIITSLEQLTEVVP